MSEPQIPDEELEETPDEELDEQPEELEEQPPAAKGPTPWFSRVVASIQAVPKVPETILGGRMRTSTIVLVITFLAIFAVRKPMPSQIPHQPAPLPVGAVVGEDGATTIPPPAPIAPVPRWTPQPKIVPKAKEQTTPTTSEEEREERNPRGEREPREERSDSSSPQTTPSEHRRPRSSESPEPATPRTSDPGPSPTGDPDASPSPTGDPNASPSPENRPSHHGAHPSTSAAPPS